MIQAGKKLWNGATVTPQLAAAYNRMSERIAAYEREGLSAPEQLLNGRHNLIANVPPC